jgi:hypothetical protein
LVELIKVGEVGTGFKFYLVKAARAEKFPFVAHVVFAPESAKRLTTKT